MKINWFQLIFVDSSQQFYYNIDFHPLLSSTSVENNIEERNPVNILYDYKNTIEVTKPYIDNGASPEIITGNYVMIKISEEKFALLSPFEKKSVNVVVGQKIKVHDIIGKLGHLGNSTMAHLHM